MDPRYPVGLILIAVGGLLAVLGLVAGFTPSPTGDDTLRFVFVALGGLGVGLIVLGVRLRNRAEVDADLGRERPSARAGGPPRWLYWVLLALFVLVVAGLVWAGWGVLEGDVRSELVVCLVMLAILLGYPLWSMRKPRGGGTG